MTPQDFQTVGLAWVGSVTVVLIGVLVGLKRIIPLFIDLKVDHAVNATKIDANNARLDRQGETQKTLLLAAPGPVTSDAPVTAPQAPVTASAGFQGIAATPAPESVNQSVVVDRATMTAAHAAMGEALAGGDTDTPPPPIKRYVDRPTNPATITPLSQE